MEEATEETSAQALGENGGSVVLSSRPENEENSLSAPLPRTTLSYLPVSSPVAPPPELVERLRQRQEENRNIPHASPRNEEDERKRRRRHLLWIASAVFASVLVLVGVILGVTLGRTQPTPSPASQNSAELQQLVELDSFDGGAALKDADSPQSKALTWLGDNTNLDDSTVSRLETTSTLHPCSLLLQYQWR